LHFYRKIRAKNIWFISSHDNFIVISRNFLTAAAKNQATL